jgi:hypothetical protein
LKIVYRKAEIVIVWDRELLQQSKPADFLEANVRLQTGDWCRRLWTVQEAVLAKDLRIQYKGGQCLDIAEITTAREEAKKDPLHTYHFLHDAGLPFSKPICRLRDPKCKDRVQLAWEAVQFRQVRVPDDESLVLASLLDLDVSQIDALQRRDDGDKSLPARRMMKLLDLLDQKPGLGIPSGIIFTPGVRLHQAKSVDTRGFEWAPLSWLTRQSHVFPKSPFHCSAADLMKHGIQVSLPGLVIHPPEEDFVQSRIWIPVHPCLHHWYKVKVNIAEKNWEAFWHKIKTRDISIILSVSDPKDRWEVGALVVSMGTLHCESVRWVQFVARVWVRLEANTTIIQTMREQFRSYPTQMSFGERLGERQRWCVDGVFDPLVPDVEVASSGTSSSSPAPAGSK